MCELGDAANAAQRYEGGGKIDWALPSKDPRRNNTGLLRRVARVEGVVPFSVEFVSVKGE